MTPTNTRYQGRILPKPTEDVVDQGLGFDLGTLVSRRSALRVFGIGAAAVGLAACGATNTVSSTSSTASSAGSASLNEIPEETAGPYPGDGSNGPDVLEQSGIVRSEIRSSFGGASGTAEGVPMTLELNIIDLANDGQPFQNAAVYVWHCDREGRYSMYSDGVEDQNYLRGVQTVDDSGKVTFTSIMPACYSGRWPHIHFEVYPDQASITDASNVIATSQVAIPEEIADAVFTQPGYEQSITNLAKVSLDTDNVFGDDSAASQLPTVSGDVTSGYVVTLAVGVDTNTVPTGGQHSGDGAPAGTPPGGPGGPGGPPPSGPPPG